MKKRLISLLLALVLALPVCAFAVEEGDEVTRTMRALDIMVGDNFGNMDLTRNVSRGEFAKLLAATSKYKDSIGGQGAGYSLFTDVKSDFWASEYIKLCLDNGWMIGYTDGSFRPWNAVTLEEACTAALRLVGYDSASLSGSFPAAQLNKASAIGLRDDMTAVQGQPLTRGDCAQLFYNLLTCKTSQGQVYATTLGYTVTDGKVDYLVTAKDDPSGPFVCEGGIPTLPFTVNSIYENDRLVSAARWEKGDVYYYNAKLGYVWVYTDRVFGLISAAASNAVTVDGKSYPLGTETVKDKLAALGDNAVGSAVTLLLGMDGKVTDARTVSGPWVAGRSATLPFQPQRAYRNGQAAQAELKEHDVYYYSTDTGTVWIYDDRVSGSIDALTPNVVTPTAVTVSGKSYPLSGSALREKMSNLNGKWEGELVTLLFGMDGSVVEVLTGSAVEAAYYGVVKGCEKTSDGAGVKTTVTVAATDGRVHTFGLTTSRSWKEGALVRVEVTAGAVSITDLARATLTGKVDAAGTRIGSYPLAVNAEIMDTSDSGAAVKVDAADLAGLTLREDKVRFYTLDEAGQISRLILSEATGETWDYGVMVSMTEGAVSRYEYWLKGAKKNLSVNGSYPVSVGRGIAVEYKADGSIRTMQSMAPIKLTGVGVTTAYAGSVSYPVAKDVQVYLKQGREYYPAELGDVSSPGLTLTGYCDQTAGKLRVIVAEG